MVAIKHYNIVNMLLMNQKKYNYNINLIDIGGGFIATKPELYNNICNVITNSIKELNLQDKQFIGEPGRFMVETSHTLILSIIKFLIAKAKELGSL
mgnify:CR=1 FL=1